MCFATQSSDQRQGGVVHWLVLILRRQRSIERNVDEAVGRGGPLYTPDEAILPKEFSGISPSEPGKGRRKAWLWEGH